MRVMIFQWYVGALLTAQARVLEFLPLFGGHRFDGARLVHDGE